VVKLCLILGSDSINEAIDKDNNEYNEFTITGWEKETERDSIREDKKNGELCQEHYSISHGNLYYYNTETNEVSWDLPKGCKIAYLKKPYYITVSQILLKHKNSILPFSPTGEAITRTEDEAMNMAVERREIIMSMSSFKDMEQMVSDYEYVANRNFLGDIKRGRLAHMVEEVAFLLQEETISYPIASSEGIHIIMRHKDGYRYDRSVSSKPCLNYRLRSKRQKECNSGTGCHC
jgi:hypothetical protein